MPYIRNQALILLRQNLNTIIRSRLPNPAKQGLTAPCLHNCLEIGEPETSAQPAIRGAVNEAEGLIRMRKNGLQQQNFQKECRRKPWTEMKQRLANHRVWSFVPECAVTRLSLTPLILR
jgi:hypothetical protein